MKYGEQFVSQISDLVRDDEVIQLEKDLISIPSYTTEEHNLAEFIADFLSDLGIYVEMQEVSVPHNKKSQNMSSFNVIGRIQGSGDGSSLMFNGHMDHGPDDGRNVDDFSKWQRDPWKPVEENGFIYGKGAQDEKGGICAFLSAARAIKRADFKLRGDLIFAPVCCHKTNSLGVKQLVSSGLRTDMAIYSENSGNCIVPVHIGVMNARVRVFGDPVHPFMRSKFPHMRKKATVMQQAIRVVEALGHDCTPHEPKTSWLTYVPHPELKDFPEHWILGIEPYGHRQQVVRMIIRTVPGQDENNIKEDLERILEQLTAKDPDFRAEVETEVWGPALNIPFRTPIVQTLGRFHRLVSGEEPNIGASARYGAYGDGGLLSEVGISTCIYGPGGGLNDLLHQEKLMKGEVSPDERIPISELVTCARVMAVTAVELCS